VSLRSTGILWHLIKSRHTRNCEQRSSKRCEKEKATINLYVGVCLF